MIIVQVNGGLGNQLFQYAAGKSLALHKSELLKLNTSHYDLPGSRPFELDLFNTKIIKAGPEEVKALEPKNIADKLIRRLKPAHLRKAYREPGFHYDSSFYKSRNTVYLKGNWQSEKYFSDIGPLIRKEFTLRKDLPAIVQQKAIELQSNESVSVHIRRGDYLQPVFLKYHGVLSPDYYNKAIANVCSRISNGKLYFFSDDIEWVKQNINLDFPHEFVSGIYSRTAIEDFYLMQQCKHNIIANSSFSWWAAWLNNNPEKIVIAPKKWFNEAPHDTKDLIPEIWVRL